jgi:TPR repeat protein
MPAATSAQASAQATPSPSAPEAFLCPISQEIMVDPVFAADGHSYERTAIETWFRTKQTSPMTNDAMASTVLTPNRLLKSQIREWQGRSSAQWVGDLISAVAMMHGDPAAVEDKLLELARFVGQHKAVVQPGTLQMVRSMLQGSQQLWVVPVQQALQVAEAECKLVVAGLAAKLRDERRDEKLAAAAAIAARGKLAQLDIEVAAAEEALDKLKQKREKQAQEMAAMQRVEEDCRSSAAQVEQDLSGYPEPLALLEEGRDGEVEPGEAPPEGQTRSKRKRAAEEEQSGTVVTKRPRGDDITDSSGELESLMREGLEWFRGSHFRTQDMARGRLLVEAAAAGGLPLAVADCRFTGDGWGGYNGDDQDRQAAFETFRELASEQKEATWIVLEAQFNLGDCYHKGRGVAKDEAEAVEWYRKAAEQGHCVAQNNLGVCYHGGTGVDKDEAEAVEWYRKAAEQGHSNGQYNLGDCYENGTGVDKDEAKAVEWYRKAAEQGDSGAQNNLGWCYEDGTGVEANEAEAVKWYRKSAEQGDSGAQNNLGDCYHWGTGVDKDEAAAVEWYRKAAEQGDSGAQNNLGYCYGKGRGVEQDEAEAVEWYRKAAEQGDTEAINAMARCYREGIGVDQDVSEASRWQQQLEDKDD